MKNLFIINEEEKNRILNLHETATKNQYLSEQPLNFGEPFQPTVGPENLQDTSGSIIKKGLGGDPYIYAKLGNDFYYAKSSDGDNPNWVLATNPTAVNSIKGKIYNEKVPVVKTVKAPVKATAKKQPVNPKEKLKVSTITNFDNFKNVDASSQVKRQLQYMKTNNILSDSKFTILDDINSKVYEINPGYKVVKSYFVLTGKNKGDELKTKTFQSWVVDNWQKALNTMYNSKGDAVKDVEHSYFAQDEWKVKNTPSGIFKRAGAIQNWLGDLIMTNLAEETYGKRFITWETLDGNIIPFGFHGTQKPERLPVIGKANEKQKISKRKMSFGCINFKESDVIAIDKFIDSGQISVWLPDATDDIVQFPSSFSKKQDINRFDKYRMNNPNYTDPGKI